MKQTTLQDVAAAAGVSAQTVSRVVNNRPDVAEATRTRVWRSIHALGYKPNILARGLVSQRSHTLGIITLPPDDIFRAQVLVGLEMEARSQGYACQLAITDGTSASMSSLVASMLERRVEGIALIAPHDGDFTFPPAGVPIVSLAHRLDLPSAINVDVDNVDGSYQAVRHLLSLGHRCIGQITGPLTWQAARDRMEGARRALAEDHLVINAAWVMPCFEWSLEAGYRAARQLIQSEPNLTAIFCHNDWLAMGTYRALLEAGYRIPEDVSVVGYDDHPICAYMQPPLTSVSQPDMALGQLMAQLLLAAVDRPTHQEFQIPASLVIRRSSAPARVMVPAQ